MHEICRGCGREETIVDNTVFRLQFLDPDKVYSCAARQGDLVPKCFTFLFRTYSRYTIVDLLRSDNHWRRHGKRDA